MKRFFAALTAAVLVLALSGCDDSLERRPKGNRGENSPQSTTESSITTQSDSTTTVPQNPTVTLQYNPTTAISRERALEIALDKAGVKRADIYDLDIELDYERGGKVWEVDFECEKMEYSYEVNSETGAITKVERERDN